MKHSTPFLGAIGLILVSLISGFLTDGCRRTQSHKAEIVRLDRAIAAYPAMTESERMAMTDTMMAGIKALFFISERGEVTDSSLRDYASSRAVTVFSPDIDSRLTAIDSLEYALGELRDNLDKELPAVKFPKIYGIVSSYNQSVFIVDSVMLVGLNHYLGADYPGYSYFEPYQRSVKAPAYLPGDVAEAILAINYPYTEAADGNSTLLSRMLYEGALIEARHRLLPDTPENTLMGYTPEQWHWLHANETNGWNALISRKMLYSVDPMVADRMLMPSPATTLLHPESPGRAGRYYGYCIVREYVRNNPDNATTEYLLSPSFYNSGDALIKSKYSGK